VSAVIVFSAMGGVGQATYNVLQPSRSPGGEKRSWLQSEWSPLRKLTDGEYRELIGEKKLKLETEIALIEDKISALRNTAPDTSAPRTGFQTPGGEE
jgi:hypothetical protein